VRSADLQHSVTVKVRKTTRPLKYSPPTRRRLKDPSGYLKLMIRFLFRSNIHTHQLTDLVSIIHIYCLESVVTVNVPGH